MDIEQLRALIAYDAETGALTCRHDGHRVGTVNKSGHRSFGIQGYRLLEHRAAWAIVHGAYPADEIDHINGNGQDNRLCNLRVATHAQNMLNRRRHKNNISGFKGVSLHRETGKWRARIKAGEDYKSLGLYETPKAAHAAYCAAATLYHGSFANSGVD